MSVLITSMFIVAALISGDEVWMARNARPYLAVACVIGFLAAVIWRLS
jgi:hypothetical protein